MLDNILVEDIKKRAYHLHKQCQEFAKEYMLDRWYEADFEFCIKEDNKINGLSRCEEHKDYIEINSGVIELHYKYFSDVMKYDKNKFLQSVWGNKEEFEVENMSYETMIQTKTKSIILDSKVIEDSRAKLLDIFVSRFIILHEFGHIFNGHCKLLGDLSSDNQYVMLMFYNNYKKSMTEQVALDIRTMEMDADAFATTQSMIHLIYTYKKFYEETNLVDMQPQDIFYWWAFAIRSHFLLCEDKFADGKYSEKMTHLPSVARWNLISNIAIEFLDSINMDDSEKEILQSKMLVGMMDAERKFNDIKMTSYSWMSQVEKSTDCKKYIDEINNNWEKIKKSLDKYARLPLYSGKNSN